MIFDLRFTIGEGGAGSRHHSDCITGLLEARERSLGKGAGLAFLRHSSGIDDEGNPEARAAGKALIAEGKALGPGRKTLIYVNNRLEGNALGTIDAMVDAA